MKGVKRKKIGYKEKTQAALWEATQGQGGH